MIPEKGYTINTKLSKSMEGGGCTSDKGDILRDKKNYKRNFHIFLLKLLKCYLWQFSLHQ